MKFDWSEGALAEGLRLYEAGQVFTAHEVWESVWLGAPEPEKTFLQGLIQVTAAFHHLQRTNPLGTVLLFQAALRRLDRYPPHLGGNPGAIVCHHLRDRPHNHPADDTNLDNIAPPLPPGQPFPPT